MPTEERRKVRACHGESKIHRQDVKQHEQWGKSNMSPKGWQYRYSNGNRKIDVVIKYRVQSVQVPSIIRMLGGSKMKMFLLRS